MCLLIVHEQKSLKESERLEKEIAEVQELKKKLSTMTADEYFDKHPELKQKFDDEIRNDYGGYCFCLLFVKEENIMEVYMCCMNTIVFNIVHSVLHSQWLMAIFVVSC
ncbi:hypothetical protein R6Q57_015838 [Mikania cordata]